MTTGVTMRAVVVASADVALRERLAKELVSLRWNVIESGGGAEATAKVESTRPEALLVDSWLPDLEVGEFAGLMGAMYAGMDVLRVDGRPVAGGSRSARRNELLHAIREAEDGAPIVVAPVVSASAAPLAPTAVNEEALPEMVGTSAPMRELTRMIRLVAPRTATVLIEGETGTGKEVVAKALHRLSARANKAFAVLNCAAIPESLLGGGAVRAHARSVYGCGAEPDGAH